MMCASHMMSAAPCDVCGHSPHVRNNRLLVKAVISFYLCDYFLFYAFFAAVRVFCMSIVIVMGPTPPGTGVM